MCGECKEERLGSWRDTTSAIGYMEDSVSKPFCALARSKSVSWQPTLKRLIRDSDRYDNVQHQLL